MAHPIVDGVLALAGSDDEAIARERAAAYQTERNPQLGGINDAFSDLAAADGALKAAVLALPHGDGSKYYREAGYFANVHTSVAAFDFLLKHLEPRAGERLLDLGADLTWTTSHLARRGLHCTAVDINHHLAAARLFFEGYGLSYDLVRADMSRPFFLDGAFDIVLAVNSLHHCSDLTRVAGNIGRMLRPGGRFAFIEPYCLNAEDRASFGAAQIDAGINEHTYLLEEWHAAFTAAGLAVKIHRVCDSFAGVYERVGAAREPDLFAGFYAAALSLATPVTEDAADRMLRVGIRIRNHGNGVWCERSVFPVRASYHLSRVLGDSTSLASFDNVRTPLPCELEPGAETTVLLEIERPAAPGRYIADVDLVHEGVRWFSEKQLPRLSVEFTVTGG